MESAPAPCPYRILDDLGSAFSMGCLGGSVWHGVRGMKNSPRGARLRGGYNTIISRAPTLGGNFAVWGGLFSGYDCGLIHLRGKEDPWNAIAAGALTGGTLAARAGYKAIGKNALIGGCLLAMIEGLSMVVTKMMSEQQPINVTLPPTPQLSQPDKLATIGTGGIPLVGTTAAAIPTNSSSTNRASTATSPSLSQPSFFSLRADEEFSPDDFSFDDSKDFDFEEKL